MKLVEQALSAYDRQQQQRETEAEASLRRQVESVKAAVTAYFGIPFEEAFDTSKVEIDAVGQVIVDNYIYLHESDGEIEVSVYHYTSRRMIERRWFTDSKLQDWNLIALGDILTRAHTEAA